MGNAIIQKELDITVKQKTADPVVVPPVVLPVVPTVEPCTYKLLKLMSTPQLVLPYEEGKTIEIMKHMLDQYLVRTNDDVRCKVDKVY